MATASRTKTETETAVEDLPTWRYDNSGEIKGTVVKLRTVRKPGANGEELVYPLLFVEATEINQAPATGTYLVHAYPSELLSELKRVQPMPGDTVHIVYQGQKKTNNKRMVRLFEVNPGSDTGEGFWGGHTVDDPGF